jgi:hypothetical protein
MKNKKIAEAYDSIQPSSEAKARVLNNILDRVHAGEAKKRRVFNAKLLAPIAACAVIALAIVIPTFMRNGGDNLLPGLIFNPIAEWQMADPNDTVWHGNNHDIGFTHTLTDEQMKAVFPALTSEFTATALYLTDGSLIEVTAVGRYRWTRIQVAEGEVVRTQIFVHENEPQVSHVHGVEVMAFMLGDDNDFNKHFQVDFMLDNIAYHITLFSPKEAGKEHLTELVNQLILGGAADLSVLANPSIPELFDWMD